MVLSLCWDKYHKRFVVAGKTSISPVERGMVALLRQTPPHIQMKKVIGFLMACLTMYPVVGFDTYRVIRPRVVLKMQARHPVLYHTLNKGKYNVVDKTQVVPRSSFGRSGL